MLPVPETTWLDAATTTLEPHAGAVGPGDPSVQVGEVIDRHYRVRGILGTGAMGTVVLADDASLGRPVAVKLVHEGLLARAGVREAFVAEARAMASVRHPNVVAVYAFGEHRGRPYLVMEYIAGTTLAAWLTQHGAPSPRDAVAMLDSLCAGVQAIHDAGAMHRDLKPGNVMIEDHGRVVVTDFGLAVAVDTAPLSTDGSVALGTPGYLAPEIARGETVDPRLATRVDTYALGVIAFELLTGARLFESDSVLGLLHDQAFTPPRRPSTVNPRLGPAFDAVVLRALTKTPGERTPDAEVLRRELRQALAADLRAPLRVLVVDDDTVALLALRELLLGAFDDAEIITVTHAGTAAEIALREHPDVVIADLRMPGGGAASLTQRLRADSRTASTPIIVVTGQGGAADWRELRALGADRFLVKPVDVDALVAMIGAVTRAR